MKFIKYQACGNDYVYIDCFEQKIENPSELSVQVSKYHFGIGSDGLILVMPSKVADAKMRIFNSDGSEAKICGNGLRCVAKFLFDEKNIKKELLSIETLAGVKCLKMISSSERESQVQVNMGRPKYLETIDFSIDNFSHSIGTYISMGNPHFVIICDSISQLDVESMGAKIQNIKAFKKEGVNVEFIKIVSRSEIDMRVCERGSGETLSCGSGACASAFCAIHDNLCDNHLKVNLLGGSIDIDYKNEEIYMTGSATKVFSGEFF